MKLHADMNVKQEIELFCVADITIASWNKLLAKEQAQAFCGHCLQPFMNNFSDKKLNFSKNTTF